MTGLGGIAPSSCGQTLPTAARVRKRREFLEIQRVGRRHPTRHFLVVQAWGGDSPARLGITVTRKIGNSVQRNRVKRAVREVFRRSRSLLPGGVSLVVIARDGSAALGGRTVEAELEPVLLRIAQEGRQRRPAESRCPD